MKTISDKAMAKEDARAEIEFKKNQEAFLKIYENERGGFLRDLINDVEELYETKTI